MLTLKQAKDKDRGKITPIALAVSRGHFEIAEYLINKGAKITSDTFYQTCKHQNIAFLVMILEKLKE